MTLINQKKMISVFSINFDKSNADQVQRAHAAHRELTAQAHLQGYFPYRLGVLTNEAGNPNLQKSRFLKLIKSAIDTKNILAPGRYESVEVRPKSLSQIEETSSNCIILPIA